MKNLTTRIVPLSAIFMMLIACGLVGDVNESEQAEIVEIEEPTREVETVDESQAPLPPTAEPPDVGSNIDKWALWANGTQLRGADIWQAVVDPEIDGLEFKGDGAVGPPFTQADFDALAALGANYVNISFPGLYSVDPPYEVNDEVVAYLDNLLAMIEQADMFAVISFRTGPGRSEYTFNRDEVGDWFDESYLNDSVWEDPAAQDGWIEMWRFTAEHYRDQQIVVGYDLMVEPNAAAVFFEIWESEEFYPQYAGTSYDWNTLYPRISDAIRDVDTDTPILIGAMGYSGVKWLPYLEPTDDPRTVYMVHQYEPGRYTHQYPGQEPWNSYPGEIDFDWDGSPDPFDRAWLDGFLSPIDAFVAEYGMPVGVNEYGPVRWVPGAAEYTADLLELFEQRGMNHAIWQWDPEWPAYTDKVNAHNIRFGPDPENVTDVENDYLDVLAVYWSRNTIRPSNAGQ